MRLHTRLYGHLRHLRESTLDVDFGRTSLYRTGDPNPIQYSAFLLQSDALPSELLWPHILDYVAEHNSFGLFVLVFRYNF